MTFGEVFEIVKMLVGKELESINPGANITITDLNTEEDCYYVKTQKGKKVRRTINELREIWEALCHEKAIHVDSVLHGSGSSRNQPETIFANLPQVEWLKHKKKKYIALVHKETHMRGTLRKMDPIKTQEVSRSLEREAFKHLVIVVSEDLVKEARFFEEILGVSQKTLEMGLYQFSCREGALVWITTKEKIGGFLKPGIYPVISAPPVFQGLVEFKLNGMGFSILNKGHMTLLFKNG